MRWLDSLRASMGKWQTNKPTCRLDICYLTAELIWGKGRGQFSGMQALCNPSSFSSSPLLYLCFKCQCIKCAEDIAIQWESWVDVRGLLCALGNPCKQCGNGTGIYGREIGVYWVLPWAYWVIIDLSHYANVEKQLVCTSTASDARADRISQRVFRH